MAAPTRSRCWRKLISFSGHNDFERPCLLRDSNSRYESSVRHCRFSTVPPQYSYFLRAKETSVLGVPDPAFSVAKRKISSISANVSATPGSQTIHDENDGLKPVTNTNKKGKWKLHKGPSLEYFIAQSVGNPSGSGNSASSSQDQLESVPYLEKTSEQQNVSQKVYFETYGCQMNVSDTEVAWSILQQNGFQKTSEILQADVILLMTCAIRERAETKIWKRLEYLKYLKRKRQRKSSGGLPVKIGILGCMAERLKTQILERERMVDVVCGPDAYRDLPRMLALTESGQTAVNVLLSLDETYGDVTPVRLNTDSQSAFVSIMRGCDNMCTYCIVPFTRGRERSRPMTSILDEVKMLSDQGIKEITLLGQNVNSYRDISEEKYYQGEFSDMSRGFSTVYKPKKGGRRFSDLLDKVSTVDPEMRIRFTSPHPKDFPDEVLHLIKERANICSQLHLPAQSGSTEMLAAMRRGYTREAYLDLVDHIRSIIPGVALSSDFIAGFCGETDQMHQDTVSLMHLVKYNFAFCFPYSMRQKTRAYHRLEDNVPADVKRRRHEELTLAFREEANKINRSQIGQIQLVLLEGKSKRSPDYMAGRNDANTKVIVPKKTQLSGGSDAGEIVLHSGDYVAVKIVDSSSQVLQGLPLFTTTLQDFYANSILSSELSPIGQTN